MNITYTVGSGLYVNLTNRCSNCCSFCVRHFGEGVGSADSLWLEREPSREEVLAEIESRRPDEFDELVFCGYGEPLERFDDVVWICRELKKKYKLPIRINTNGQSDLITGRDTAPELKGAVDSVSISLNAPDPESYAQLCEPVFGEKTFAAILKFTKACKEAVPDVTLSVVDVIAPEQIERCRAIADSLGVKFRVRKMWTKDNIPEK